MQVATLKMPYAVIHTLTSLDGRAHNIELPELDSYPQDGLVHEVSLLLVIGGAAEYAFRALDTATGRELWSHRLATSAKATPMTYRSPVSGRQFVVVAEGGRSRYGTKPGTKLVAFALPSTEK